MVSLNLGVRSQLKGLATCDSIYDILQIAKLHGKEAVLAVGTGHGEEAESEGDGGNYLR